MAERYYLKRCRGGSTSSLAETIANTEDLLTEILVRVPALPLVRFKCVSKYWLSLISDAKFCHRHTLQNPNPPISAVFSCESRHFGYIRLRLDQSSCSNTVIGSDGDANHGNQSTFCNPLNFAQNLFILQSCNGLLLCCSVHINTPYYVFNPTTNKFSALVPPAAAAAACEKRIFGSALAFDPSKSPHYKAVFIWTFNKECFALWDNHIEIYSSETRSWTLHSPSFRRDLEVDYNQGVYCNGAVHWVGVYRHLYYYHVDEERVGYVVPPIDSEEESKKMGEICARHFHESYDGSHLQLIDIYWSKRTKFQVLEMGRDYSGWFVKYDVDYDPIHTAYPGVRNIVVLFVAPEENDKEEVTSSLLLHTPGKVISYNLLTSKIFKSFDLPPNAAMHDSRDEFPPDFRLFLGKNYRPEDPPLLVDRRNYRYMETLACV